MVVLSGERQRGGEGGRKAIEAVGRGTLQAVFTMPLSAWKELMRAG